MGSVTQGKVRDQAQLLSESVVQDVEVLRYCLDVTLEGTRYLGLVEFVPRHPQRQSPCQ